MLSVRPPVNSRLLIQFWGGSKFIHGFLALCFDAPNPMLLKGQLYLLSGPLQKESADHWARGWQCREKWTGLPYTSGPSLFTDSILANSTTRENLFVIPQTVARGRFQSFPATPDAPVPSGGRTRPCSAFWVVLYYRQVILSTVSLAPCCLLFLVAFVGDLK